MPEQVSVAMNEIAADMREGLLALAVGAGLRVMQQLMEADVTAVWQRQALARRSDGAALVRGRGWSCRVPGSVEPPSDPARDRAPGSRSKSDAAKKSPQGHAQRDIDHRGQGKSSSAYAPARRNGNCGPLRCRRQRGQLID